MGNTNIEFDEIIGHDCVISIDSIEDHTLIKKENRSGYNANCIEAQYVKPEETNKLIVIVDKKDHNKIITFWPGKYTPDFPKLIRNNNAQTEIDIHKKCSQFWENHAFIVAPK